MIKLLIAARRRAGQTQAEFRHYVKERHAPLVLQDPEAIELIRRYTQNHVFDAAYGATGSSSYPQVSERDIITELWFDSADTMQQAQRTTMYREVIQLDEDNFADQASVLAFPVREEEVSVPRPRATSIKVIHYLKQAAGISEEDFARSWRDAHASITVKNPEISNSLARYVQNYALLNPRGAPDERTRYGIAMLWFDNRDAIPTFHAYHEQLMASATQHGDFLDPTQSFFVFAEEFRLKEQAQ